VNFRKAFRSYISSSLEETSLYQVTLRIIQVNAVEDYFLTVRLINRVPILQNIPFRVKIESKLLKYLRSLARRNDENKPVMKMMKIVDST
jgi:hypothetical protein